MSFHTWLFLGLAIFNFALGSGYLSNGNNLGIIHIILGVIILIGFFYFGYDERRQKND